MAEGRNDIEAKINAHAWKDPAFKEKLMKNPKEALTEFGLKGPAHAKIQVLEESEDNWYLVLRRAPPNAKDLSEEDLLLQDVAAGRCL